MSGLDLFSGIGGLTVALAPWVRPITYCENDSYAQGVLLSRMRSEGLPIAPIWDDVTSLSSEFLPAVDIIYGGFPCQDISVAAPSPEGLDGKRSGLVFEVFRLVDELQPTFVFLENVPAIRTRGGERVVKELASRGYDCRWEVLSAEEVGAPHRRQRWFLLAARREAILAKRTDSLCERLQISSQRDSEKSKVVWASGSNTNGLHNSVPYPQCIDIRNQLGGRPRPDGQGEARPGVNGEARPGVNGEAQSVAHSDSKRSWTGRTESMLWQWGCHSEWHCGWAIEPDVGRVAHGIPCRVDRIRGLGNAVVPLQARTAFMRLMGLTKEGV